jgi:hypothetical protein
MRTIKIGDKFNRLTVVKFLGGKNGYICQCDCGNTTKSRSSSLKSGRHASCGCLAKEKLALRNFKDGFVALKNEIFKNYKKAAENRGYCFDLTKEEFYNLISDKCFYCGVDPLTSWCGNKRTIIDTTQFKYNGVDRVDNSNGYTLENCVTACKICNNAKNTLSKESFLEWINKVYNYQNKINK